ncbi:hypothetical protein RDI58_009875 [Solanum bulbocastanum]|uniref:MATH domain-containing protein n=1 Tax=Solanum bulbocastanum TaxID=147425 RepID=A0AAN8YEX2_SOLBU
MARDVMARIGSVTGCPGPGDNRVVGCGGQVENPCWPGLARLDLVSVQSRLVIPSKWLVGPKTKMIIHPDGDGNGAGHISVYLAVIGKSSAHTVWEEWRSVRNIKNEWGFSKCISHETFKDLSNGYLIDDKCIFGVDVYAIKNQGIGECMSLLNEPELYKLK